MDALTSVIYYMEMVEVIDKPKVVPHYTTSSEYDINHRMTPIVLSRTENISGMAMLWKWTVILYMLLLWRSYGK